MKRLAGLASALLLGACSVVGIRGGTETAPYDVVEPIGVAEVRRYAPRLAAETVVDGPEEAARSAGFRRLAAYIFGQNRGKTEIAMTAPVAQSAEAAQEIAMTAPVAAQATGTGSWIIRFFVPAQYTLETLPAPVDPAIRIVTVPAETVAAYRFSGSRSAASMPEAREVLFRELRGSRWMVSGKPVDWFYDPPWTLPMFRRNEVVVPVEPGAG
jgi:hypothetical protein